MMNQADSFLGRLGFLVSVVFFTVALQNASANGRGADGNPPDTGDYPGQGGDYAKELPPCYDQGRRLPLNNEQVIHWRNNTANAFKARAFIVGTVVQVFEDRNDHDHFEIQIGSNEKDIIEVVYNKFFGELPEIQLGMKIHSCGDYITSFQVTGPYPPSPSGAIIHWLHMNPRNKGHDHGYLAVDGKVYGYDYNRVRPIR